MGATEVIRLGDLIQARGGEIKTGPFGTKLKASEYSTEGWPVISVGEIQVGRLLIGPDTPRVSTEVIARMPEFLLRAGDIVVARKGGVDRSTWISETEEGYFLGSDGLRIRVPDGVDSRFVAFQLRSPQSRSWLMQHSTGSTMPSLSGKVLSLFPVLLPPLPEQRRIAEILGALDDKIELNRKMNKTLEEMAQAIFNEALMGCDPSSGEVPVGWSLKTLGEAAKESGGAVQTGPFGSQLHASDYVKLGVPSVMPKDLKDDRISTSGVARVPEADAERLAKHRLVSGDVVYSRRGDVERRALVLERETGWLCGTGCLRVRLGAATYNAHFLYQYLGLPTIRAWIVRHAQGATMPNLNTQILGSLPFCFPSSTEQERIGRIVGTLHLKREANFSESDTLVQLRDTLLPKLVSGELRVKDAERIVEKTV